MLTIGFLDLQQQGDSTILLLPNGNSAIIVDLPEAETAWQYLEANLIHQIEVIFLTHFDDDHVKDIIIFCNQARKENFEIKEIRYNYSNALSRGKKLPEKSRIILKALEDLKRRGFIKTEMALASMKLKFFDVEIKIIFPGLKDLEESFFRQTGRNEGCIILVIDYNEKRILFGADLLSKGWKKSYFYAPEAYLAGKGLLKDTFSIDLLVIKICVPVIFKLR